MINLIVGPEVAPTSCDAEGCTAETKEYLYDLAIHNKAIKANFFPLQPVLVRVLKEKSQIRKLEDF